MTQFFTLVNQNNISYDAICRSYCPFFHGPLTDAQAAQANPSNQPVEQDVLMKAANTIGKPIFMIETAEHYENGFDSNDPWYNPPSQSLQAKFLNDLQAAQQVLPNSLGMGIEYWNPAGVNIPRLGGSGGWFNGGTNLLDAIYIWNGLTIFDNADASGNTNVNNPGYSTPLRPWMRSEVGKHIRGLAPRDCKLRSQQCTMPGRQCSLFWDCLSFTGRLAEVLDQHRLGLFLAGLVEGN